MTYEKQNKSQECTHILGILHAKPLFFFLFPRNLGESLFEAS
jgi:hypothetical protein